MAGEVIKSIQDKVTEQVAGLGPRVESFVVDKMVDRELEKRGPAIVQGMDKLAELEAELKKQDKPDVKSLNADGTTKDEAYSPKRFEEVKKLKERINKLTSAIDKAYNNGDLKELNQLIQSGNKDQAKGGTEATGEAS